MGLAELGEAAETLVPDPKRSGPLEMLGGPGIGVPSRTLGATEDERERTDVGVDARKELMLEIDCVRVRSAGGVGGRIDQPKRATTTAVSEGIGSGSGCGAGAVDGESPFDSLSKSGGKAGFVTDDTVENRDWT